MAQQQDSAPSNNEQVAEVTVTAQRMAAPASKTPVSMAILAGERLRDGGIDSPSALGARVPSVHLDGLADGLRITIRGVSNADSTEKGDPSAAFMLDGIYIARPQLQNISFFDIDRVEVLRGPQGTLYGRNSTAGVVNVISNTPGKQLEGALGAEVGNFASRKANAMINVPVSDALALRAAVAYNKHDSYLANGQGTGFGLGLERDDTAARLSARLAMGRSASLLLRYDSSTLRNNNDSIVPVSNFYAFGADGQPVWIDASTGSRLTNRFMPPNAPLQQAYGRAKADGLGAEFEWNLGGATLHYLGSHRKSEYDHKANFHYGVAPGFALGVRQSFGGQYRQDSHELRIVSNGAGPLKAQAGVYYFREDADVLYSFRDLVLLGLPPYYVFPLEASSVSKAVFGQATYSLAPSLRVTAGVRYSDDDKSRVGSTNFQQGATFNPATDFRLLNAAAIGTHKATWRLGAEYDLSLDTMAFATVSTGYKAGGFNDGCVAGSMENGIACPAQVAVPAGALFYQPETLTSYEAGVKAAFWNRKATLNATAFYYDYSNLQLSGVVVVHGAPRFVTTNAGVASVTGLEIDGQLAATASDRISYSLSLVDAHYKSYAPDGVQSWAGRKLDRSPRASASLGYEHTFRVGGRRLTAGLFARASAAYMISVPSQLLQYRVPGRTQTDLNAGYQPDGASWSLHAHVKNLENKVLPIAIDSFGMVVPGDPRTYGVRLDYRF